MVSMNVLGVINEDSYGAALMPSEWPNALE